MGFPLQATDVSFLCFSFALKTKGNQHLLKCQWRPSNVAQPWGVTEGADTNLEHPGFQVYPGVHLSPLLAAQAAVALLQEQMCLWRGVVSLP